MRYILICLLSWALAINAQNSKPTRAELYDKVLGALVGSAIGDAMGAPVEMWTRDYIQTNYGFIQKPDTMVREPSAEGPWRYNLPAGGTTDDTRWKKLTLNYLFTQKTSLNDVDFANHFLKEYRNGIKQLKNTEGTNSELFENNLMVVNWLKEWAQVAEPFAKQDLRGYSAALSRFYGGEMVCAGLLYAPAVGVFYPADPQLAYQEMYKISLFDLGYARGISAITAAMTAAAMAKNATPESVLNSLRDIDPQQFFKSRLVGRTAYRQLMLAREIVFQANKLQKKAVDLTKITFPKNQTWDTLTLARLYKAYELLDVKNQDMPFHAGEIHLINLTALLFCNFDFEKSLAFVVNYGRDNDTVGAVTGGILGAYSGAKKLPKQAVERVLTTNKELLQTDFEALANQLTDQILAR